MYFTFRKKRNRTMIRTIRVVKTKALISFAVIAPLLLPIHVVGFLICSPFTAAHHSLLYEPPREKTNNLHMRKQRRRSASL